MREQIAEVSLPLDDMDARVAALGAPTALSAVQLEEQRQTVIAEVLPQLAPLQSRARHCRDSSRKLEITQDLSREGGVEVLDPAVEPSSPSSPDIVTNLVVGGLVGVLAGIALAFVVERMDDSVRSKETAERLTGLPTLGVIPRASGGSNATGLTILDDPCLPGGRGLSPPPHVGPLPRPRRVHAQGAGHERRTLGGQDRRRREPGDRPGPRWGAPSCSSAPTSAGHGCTSCSAPLRLRGSRRCSVEDVSAESATYAIKEVPGLHVMPPGPAPPNPAELLDSARVRDLFESLSEVYDTVDRRLASGPPRHRRPGAHPIGGRCAARCRLRRDVQARALRLPWSCWDRSRPHWSASC